MATTANARNLMLEDDSPRTLAVELPSDYTTTGDHSGTLGGEAQTNFQNTQITLSSNGVLENAGGGQITDFLGTWNSLAQTVHRNDQITLSSNGTLNNAGGGSITDLDYSNVSGTKPAADADNTQDILENAATEISVNSDLFNIYGSGAAGVFIGSGGLFGRDSGGSTTFSITASSGAAAFRGNITGGANIDITGTGTFNGASNEGYGNAAINANTSLNTTNGVIGRAGSGNGVHGFATSGVGVLGQASSAGGAGGSFSASGGAVALEAFGNITLSGSITISTQTINNLTAGYANGVDGSDVSGIVGSAQTAVTAGSADTADFATNASQLNSYSSTSYTRQVVTDSGTANASSAGVVLQATVSGVRTRATGGRNIVIESFSDEELKFDINPETLGLDFLMKLKPITYQVKHNPGVTFHGLGARATGKILKRDNDALCITHDDGVKGVDYNSVIAVLIKSVQELTEKLEILENNFKLKR